ncbi:hypothetical protein HRR83_004731 [Exophiala dermatitidis]|uniref:HAD superfamily hydrolase n=1 Tax=Exophiala dermatitidis TaxID=5970 RepID=A0AAN6EZQ4_EXODE|nr:hypothetical protein HRR75_003655 [Exophiala dermatitidis]KAJ4519247.1 hypothetical protein HRR74_003988 [Exophiala dermatitidis]KAJ4529063.1 hypothetical protein HRR73_000083 [Exophiala dermatitidis]KAJ4538461.1 hypothetical protein HRR77_006945 [Exophiala dermatitidis]KAJ4544292.1 hypothetical protein HRR76_002358 [Exophiala dermatitidis]
MGSSNPLPTQRREFPPIRACIFDMDGLLIDSEDKYTEVTNTILRENNRPPLPWHIKAQLQGRPGPAAGKIFHEWAQLPISREEFMQRLVELQAEAFQHCKPLPGVEDLLRRLQNTYVKSDNTSKSEQQQQREKVHLALATSSHSRNYEIKTVKLRHLFDVFPDTHKILGDDPRIPTGRGKPLPDIYLLALQAINDTVMAQNQNSENGEQIRPIEPHECLVFEDSVPGVEAGRRAGMRVVWCPHPQLLEVYKGREEEVLAGRTGEHKEDDLDHAEGIPIAGSPGQVGEIGDGWAELLTTLEDFDFAKYGIEFDAAAESAHNQATAAAAASATTDKALEEMTAMADGKHHAPEEPPSVPTPVPSMT